jgi:hypothetical protein
MLSSRVHIRLNAHYNRCSKHPCHSVISIDRVRLFMAYSMNYENNNVRRFGTITRQSTSSITLLATVTIMFALALAHFIAGIRGWLTEGLGGFKNLESSSVTGRVLLVTLTINVRNTHSIGTYY